MQPDRGLQQERTTLAWSRTGLSLAAGAFVIARHAGVEGGVVFALLATAAGLVTIGVVMRVRRTGRPVGDFRVLEDGAVPAMLACVAATLCLLEIWVFLD